MLVGYSALMPSSFQSPIKGDAPSSIKQSGGEGEEDEREGWSSPFTPFIIHPKQILFHQVSEDFGRRLYFNNEASFRLKLPLYLVPNAIQTQSAARPPCTTPALYAALTPPRCPRASEKVKWEYWPPTLNMA